MVFMAVPLFPAGCKRWLLAQSLRAVCGVHVKTLSGNANAHIEARDVTPLWTEHRAAFGFHGESQGGSVI
jgi:hypothetical protein